MKSMVMVFEIVYEVRRKVHMKLIEQVDYKIEDKIVKHIEIPIFIIVYDNLRNNIEE